MSEKDMNKKKAMDNLLNGLTTIGAASPSEEPPQASSKDTGNPGSGSAKVKGRRGRPPRGEEWETAYIVVNSEKYGKIREIADMSGKKIKDVVDIAFGDYIRKVEKKIGTVRIRRKIDLDSLNDE